ncbi:GNAT family N-acetyltransferase [Nocardioides abyssi]|uniref:GNAT family N-acetyltransferase n=1 Tax=Nocardioides abyssi TaxID=3058370 RepID=A0ABT8EQ11_9ACTN|nr:GNAT family N-acetyltransferase [Nocardioides abyssi]MDN4160113.1 GNAT family N-acetyltransferase [Nocardioides abyssi]
MIVRPRRPEDVPALVEVLAAQRAGSPYPMRWPLPFPVEQFIVRSSEEASWVAEVGGRVVGHVAACSVPDPHDFPVAGHLASVSVLFVDPALRGAGVGGRLLDTAVAWMREHGRVPVLDVVPRHSTAVEVYRHRGWVEVGRLRPDWLPADEADLLLMTLPGPVESERRTVPT